MPSVLVKMLPGTRFDRLDESLPKQVAAAHAPTGRPRKKNVLFLPVPVQLGRSRYDCDVDGHTRLVAALVLHTPEPECLRRARNRPSHPTCA